MLASIPVSRLNQTRADLGTLLDSVTPQNALAGLPHRCKVRNREADGASGRLLHRVDDMRMAANDEQLRCFEAQSGYEHHCKRR